MEDRKEILSNLIYYDKSLDDIKTKLKNFSWDCETPLIIMNNLHLSSVLKRCIEGHISVGEIVDWANTIECRDDIDFQSSQIQEIVFQLASPEINGEITKMRLNHFLKLIT